MRSMKDRQEMEPDLLPPPRLCLKEPLAIVYGGAWGSRRDEMDDKEESLVSTTRLVSLPLTA